MRKVLLILSLLFLLTGCGKKEIYGQILSIETSETHTELTLLGQKRSVFVDDQTHVYSFSDDIPYEKLLDGELREPQIWVHDFSFRKGKLVADYICVESILLPEPYVLSDGTQLNIRKHHLYTAYETEDDVCILRETDPVGPANVHGGGAPSLDTLSTQAQETITAYYQEQGLLYDLDAELEKAYKAFLSMGNPAGFSTYHLSQEIVPMAANGKIISFATILTFPIDGSHVQEVRYSTVFDRETGDMIPMTDLFQCLEEEIPEKILSAAKLNDPALAKKLTAAFRLEHLNLQSDAIELWFPKNTLEGLEENHVVCVEYEDLAGILHPWAIPDPIE